MIKASLKLNDLLVSQSTFVSSAVTMSLSVSFAGKKVLITGGGQGLGRCIVKRLYDEGAIVFTVDKEKSLIEDLQKECPKITAVLLDLTDVDKTKEVVESFGPLDLLVNNAGVLITESFLDITPDAITKIMDVNWKAMVIVGQVVARGMIANKSGGAILNVSSMVSRTAAVPGLCVYSCSKAAVTMLTKSMAIELGPHNIRVNCIAPTAIETPFITGEAVGVHIEEAIRATLERNIIKRLIQPNEVVDLIFFLLSPLASMITGEEVFIDAGFTIS